MFIPLHTKSDYSAGYGTATVEELVRRAADYRYPAVALTDVENLYGQVRFQHAARAAGIKPITGVELRAQFGPGMLGRKEGRLILIARNRAGYESLCRVITIRRSGGSPDHEPIRCLEANPTGIFFLSDDETVLRALLKEGVNPGDIRFLLMRPGSQPAPSFVRAVADTDAVMLDSRDRDLHVLQTAIRRGQTVAGVRDAEPPEHILPSPDMLRQLFGDAPDALAESLRVGEACTLDLTHSNPAFPSIELPEGQTAEERLDNLCWKRLSEGRLIDRWQGTEYEARLRRELDILKTLGFAAYFLIVAEIADHARSEGATVAGRGSAASSFAAHLLGITQVDPVRHGLLFERFIHSDRAELPDIDLDLPSHRRDEVIEWVFRRFGRHRVAMVSAHQTFQRRAAYREGLKALGMRLEDVGRFSKQIPPPELEGEGDVPMPLDLLPEEFRSKAPLIERLIGKHQHISVHPGGVVIAEPRIDTHAPLERAPKGVLVTQYDMHSLEKLRLIKIDLLGNRALSAIQEAIRWTGAASEIPLEDPSTLEALNRADTVGCFQIETPAMRSTLKQLPIRGIDDVMAALAIVRPGPASGQAKSAYIRRARGETPSTPPISRPAEQLNATHGMLLYEEDLMAAISTMTGWPLERSDCVRSELIQRQNEPEALAALGREFVEASTMMGSTKAEAVRVWRILVRFAAYTFNKAHAASYAIIAWQTAYFKTHFPAAFGCGVLNIYGGLYPLRSVAADFTRHGVRLIAPHVNYSQPACTLESGGIRVGLGSVKRLTMKNRAQIFNERPFSDLADFLRRVSISHRELESLILCGACDGLSPLRSEDYPFAHEELVAYLIEDRSGRVLADLPGRPQQTESVELYQELVRVRNELRFLDLHVTDHPMRILRAEAARAGCVPIAEVTRGKARIAGLVAASRRLATQGKKIMQFVTFEDETGLLEAALFPGIYASLADPVNSPGPYLVEGRVMEERGDLHLAVSSVQPFHTRPEPYASR